MKVLCSTAKQDFCFFSSTVLLYLQKNSSTVPLQNNNIPMVYLCCAVSYTFTRSVKGTILLRMVWCGEFFFFLKRNVNYVLIKPCPFLAPSPTTSYEGAGTAKGLSTRELLCLPESTWCPWVTNCPAKRHLTLPPGQAGLGQRWQQHSTTGTYYYFSYF